MEFSNPIKLIMCIVGCELAGGIGSIFTFPAIATWYSTLAKPALTPPAWVFAPVWTILFALMGVALYLVWIAKAKPLVKKQAYTVFAVQFILNITWSALFFGLHSPFLALVDIALLWLAILATIIEFNRISRNAALLLIPYIAWVSLAAYLNYSIWILNG